MLALLLFACASEKDDAASAEEAFLAPDQPGQYQASTEAFPITVSDGVETTLQVWYPTEATDGSLHEYDDLFTYGALDEEAPACDTPRPVVMFSHGNTGIRYQSMFLTEWLAARGYVVAAPDHTHNTFLDQDDSMLEELVFRRPGDISDSFDWLVAASQESGHPLEGCVDPDAGYAMGGHSFGGYTTMAVAGGGIDVAAAEAFCEDDYGWLCDAPAWWEAANPGSDFADIGDRDRVWAAFPMAPAGHEVLSGTLPDVAAPTLVLGGGNDTTTTMAGLVAPIYDDLTITPRYLAELVDADHFTFSDMCYLLPTTGDCQDLPIDPDYAHDLINVAVTAHLDAARGFEEATDWLPYDIPEYEWVYTE